MQKRLEFKTKESFINYLFNMTEKHDESAGLFEFIEEQAEKMIKSKSVIIHEK